MKMENDKEALVAEIEQFIQEAMKMHIVQVLADSYKNTSLFEYVIGVGNEVWWMKTQAHQLWQFWQAAKAHEAKKLEGCVVNPVWIATDFLLPDEDELVLFMDKNKVIHDGFLSTDYVDGPYGENGEDFGDNQTLWTSNSNGEELLPSKVKYWMVRPDSPVEAARGGNHE